MAESSISFFLENLKQLVANEYTLFSNEKEDLRKLQSRVESLKAAIADSAHKKFKGVGFRNWEKDVRNIIYKAEDAIDSAERRAVLKKLNPDKRRQLIVKVKKILNEIDQEFADVKSKFDKLALDTPNEADRLAKLAAARLRMTEPVKDKIVVGFDDVTTYLIEMLKENTQGVEAISIVGMAGLGKTTVASKIFHDQNIEEEFTKRIWVNVSQEYTMRDICIKILNQHNSRIKDWTNKSDQDLVEEVKKCLTSVKFLLVVDDVWTEEAWEDIKGMLPTYNLSSKVLITSRDKKVAVSANPHRDPYCLRFLRYEEVWELLELVVFDKKGEWPSDLKEIGEKIAHNCKGLPLAVVVTGGILRGKSRPVECRKREWSKVANGVAIDDNRKVDGLKNIISLSYDAMEDHLRGCFLYLSVFPEDFEISVWKLARLWIAEGLIEESSDKDISLEEIAENNLMQLIDINLVMVEKKSARGGVKTCHVHDMIRDFCKEQAAGKFNNFVKEVKKLSNQGKFEPTIQKIGAYRRLCIHSNVLEFIKMKPEASGVRSFLCLDRGQIEIPPETAPLILEAFELLRVFEGSSIRFPRFFSELTMLIHLRYISLTVADEFQMLPHTISNLRSLQTLVIDTSLPTFTIKVDLSKMGGLRHLKTKAGIVSDVKKGGEPNTSLQTLDRLSIKSCKAGVLKNTPNLKTLGIRGDLSSLLEEMTSLHCLQKLKLIHDSKTKLGDFLENRRFPRNLRCLTLEGTYMDWISMPVLGSLEKLEVLKLKEYAFTGKEWTVGVNEFPCLEYLSIERCEVAVWTMMDGSFPQLLSLVIKNCEKFCGIPIGLAASKKFQALQLKCVSKKVVDSAAEIKKMKQENQGESSSSKEFRLEITTADVHRANAPRSQAI